MNNKNFVYFWFILLLEYLFILIIPLNYDIAWMNPETMTTHTRILANGSQWKSEDWQKFLNIENIEFNSDRLSRPLSNFVEVVNAKWRAWCWRFMLPHPAVSLLWPFMLVVLPYLLYLTFLNMGCFSYVAFAGVCIYIASIGYLSPLAMLFHPAKNLVNFFAVLTMFLFSLPYKRMSNIPTSCHWLIGGGFVSIFLCFISDETGLYVYVMALVLFYRLWWQLWSQKIYGLLVGLLALPLMYILTVGLFLPWVHWLANHKLIHFSNYERYPSISSLFFPNLNNLFQNTIFLFKAHPHLWINYTKLLAHPILMSIQIIYLVFYALIIWIGGRTLICKNAKSLDKNFIQLAGLGFLLLIGFCFFQTFQLSKDAKVWGIWWYGCLFSLIYVFTLVFFLQFIFSYNQRFSKSAVLLTGIFVINGLVFATYQIAIFKKHDLNMHEIRYNYVDIFNEKMDYYQYFSFKDTFVKSGCKGLYTYVYWEKWRSNWPHGIPSGVPPSWLDSCQKVMSGDNDFIIERVYLSVELK